MLDQRIGSSKGNFVSFERFRVTLGIHLGLLLVCCFRDTLRVTKVGIFRVDKSVYNGQNTFQFGYFLVFWGGIIQLKNKTTSYMSISRSLFYDLTCIVNSFSIIASFRSSSVFRSEIRCLSSPISSSLCFSSSSEDKSECNDGLFCLT